MITRELVEAALFKMGMSASLKGFGYIVDSVLTMNKEKNIKITYLYFRVAKIYGTTAQRVERSIRHAFETVRGCKGDYDVVNHYIGFANCTNSASLSMLLLRLREEIKKKENYSVSLETTQDITEERFLELMRQSQKEFLKEIMNRLKM